MTLPKEIEKKGKESQWAFMLYNKSSAHKIVLHREHCERLFRAGYTLLNRPEGTTAPIAPKPEMGVCAHCGAPTQAVHLDDGVCPSCLEGNWI